LTTGENHAPTKGVAVVIAHQADAQQQIKGNSPDWPNECGTNARHYLTFGLSRLMESTFRTLVFSSSVPVILSLCPAKCSGVY
jgi:hypothetical protein